MSTCACACQQAVQVLSFVHDAEDEPPTERDGGVVFAIESINRLIPKLVDPFSIARRWLIFKRSRAARSGIGLGAGVNSPSLKILRLQPPDHDQYFDTGMRGGRCQV
jgi:hypothetical protein